MRYLFGNEGMYVVLVGVCLVVGGMSQDKEPVFPVYISEVMASNGASVPDDRGEYGDWIEIWNSSANDIDMFNVGLSDDELSISFLFPKMTLAAGERIIVYCDKTNQATAGKPLHAKFGLSTNGEHITLSDYASAGKTWSDDSKVAVWMRTE